MHMKIPLNRIGALVGPNGRIKREIEKRLVFCIDFVDRGLGGGTYR